MSMNQEALEAAKSRVFNILRCKDYGEAEGVGTAVEIAIETYLSTLNANTDRAELVEDAISVAVGDFRDKVGFGGNDDHLVVKSIIKTYQAASLLSIPAPSGVPNEATNEMIAAGLEVLAENGISAIDRDPVFVWRAMYRAAIRQLGGKDDAEG